MTTVGRRVDEVVDEDSFVLPTKEIHDESDISKFLVSIGCQRVLSFLLRANNAVSGLPVSRCPPAGPATDRLLGMLADILKWVEEVPPPSNHPGRFGNPAFRTWHALLTERAANVVQSALRVSAAAAREVAAYLIESFGNEVRIDFGTGHEANFLAFLTCAEGLGVLDDDFDNEDSLLQVLVLRVFAAYWSVCRKVQRTYMLEPAGSHGVWGLDDFHFLPYLWGASQLRNHNSILPEHIHNRSVVLSNAKDYFYLRAILDINETKTGPFAEHSPLLNDISGVRTWSKTNKGMVKMFMAEVLGKFPVIQHFRFGSILRFEAAKKEDVVIFPS